MTVAAKCPSWLILYSDPCSDMFISDIVAEVEEFSVCGSIPEGEGGDGEDTFYHLLIVITMKYWIIQYICYLIAHRNCILFIYVPSIWRLQPPIICSCSISIVIVDFFSYKKAKTLASMLSFTNHVIILLFK